MRPIAYFTLIASCAAALACSSDDDAPTRGGPGDRCDNAIALELSPELVPTRVEGDTTRMHDDLVLDACQAVATADTPGEGSGDIVYRVRSAVAATYRFTLDAPWPAPTALALATDCGGLVSGDRASCVASSLGDVTADTIGLEATLAADTDYFLIVDGRHASGRPDEGHFALQIGCGCALDETCEASGACRPRQAGDSCDEPHALTPTEPFVAAISARGSTVGEPDSGFVPATCTASGTSIGSAAPDRVHSFTAPVAGRYTVTLTSLDGAALALAAFAGCSSSVRDATCIAAATTDDTATAAITIDLGAADTAALLVDSGAIGGSYELSVAPPCVPSCAHCGGDDGCGSTCACTTGHYCLAGTCTADDTIVGNACTNPHALATLTLPVVASGDLSTTGLGPTHDALGCPGVAATGAHVNDEVWRLVVPETGTYRVTLTPLGQGVDLLAYAFVGSDCAPDTCVAYADAVAAPHADDERLIVPAEAGTDLTIVVGAWRAEAVGPYRLTFDRQCETTCAGGCGQPDGCGGTCGCGPGELCETGACLPPESIVGNTCASAFTLTGTSMPFTGRGDIGPGARATPTYSAAACDAFVTGGSSPDQVWGFTAMGVGVYEITLTPDDPRSDLMLYAFTDAACTHDCAGFTDEVHAGQAAPEVLTLDVHNAGERFFFVVDAWTPDAGGAYTISARLACAPVCASDSCGQPDSCGGVCGCGDDASCVGGQCVAHDALLGNTCEAPFTLDVAAPTRGDLAAFDAIADLTPTGCAGTPNADDAGHDQVFRFVAPSAGTWEISATPDDAALDLVVYAYPTGDCGGACLGLADRSSHSTTAETLRLVAATGDSFDVVVDGANAAARGAYRVSARLACSPVCDGVTCGQDDGCGARCACAEGDLCRADICLAAADVAGDRCDYPRVLGGLAAPYVDTGDLAAFGALADDVDAATCSSGATGAGSPDELWVFDAPAAGLWEVTVTPDSGGLLGDLIVYAWDGAGCDGACLGAADDGGPDASERLTLDAHSAGQRFTIAVDAWLVQTTDRYSIRVDRPIVGGP